MTYNKDFDVKYFSLYEECKNEFKDEPQYLDDLDLFINQLYKDEFLYVLGNSTTIEEATQVITNLWNLVKTQDRNDNTTLLHWVCNYHRNHSIDESIENIEMSFITLFSFNEFHKFHKIICSLLAF